MDKAQLGIVPATGYPSMHSAQMTINAVPHDLPHETADFLEAIDAIELRHPKRRVVAMALMNQPIILMDIRFSAAGGDPGIRIHPLDQYLKVARRQVKIQIELADEIVLAAIDGLISGIKSVHYARTHGTMTAIDSRYNRYPLMQRRVFGQYRRSFVRGTIVYDDPFRRP